MDPLDELFREYTAVAAYYNWQNRIASQASGDIQGDAVSDWITAEQQIEQMELGAA